MFYFSLLCKNTYRIDAYLPAYLRFFPSFFLPFVSFFLYYLLLLAFSFVSVFFPFIFFCISPHEYAIQRETHISNIESLDRRIEPWISWRIFYFSLFIFLSFLLLHLRAIAKHGIKKSVCNVLYSLDFVWLYTELGTIVILSISRICMAYVLDCIRLVFSHMNYNKNKFFFFS